MRSRATLDDRTAELSSAVQAWASRGSLMSLCGHEVFVADVAAAMPSDREPLVVLHGFPTSSFDYAGVIDALATDRRVICPDFPGFGLSDKPDIEYTIGGAADVVVALTEILGLDSVSLLTHDMGDTVGGELLARQSGGTWPVEIIKRVVTNGSIYIETAALTGGQQMLLSMPDERVDAALAPTGDMLAVSLYATLSPTTTLEVTDLLDHGALVAADGGARNLARLVRYINERRANERRFTGAIESHPSPVAVVWGTDDPIAVPAMCDQFLDARPDATLTLLDGIGHYPMLEAPEAYLTAVRAGLA